jgi:iron complex transport system ATP-binding protein
MTFTDTAGLADRLINTLSGGERQRVLMARALAQEPRLLLLDEPTANLDVQHQLQIMELIRSLVDDGLAALAAMHDLNMASTYCDRVYVMKDRKIFASGPPEEVLQPALLRSVFGVGATVDTHPATGKPRISFYVDGASDRR